MYGFFSILGAKPFDFNDFSEPVHTTTDPGNNDYSEHSSHHETHRFQK
jgi:hypothetical protein